MAKSKKTAILGTVGNLPQRSVALNRQSSLTPAKMTTRPGFHGLSNLTPAPLHTLQVPPY